MKRVALIAIGVTLGLFTQSCNKSQLTESSNEDGPLHPSDTPNEEAAVGTNPYLDRVVEYRPAPGQFVNVLPVIEAGAPVDTVLKRCTRALANDRQRVVTLGGFGGYITFAFDHRVKNRSGRDIMIHGNAFRSETDRSRGNGEPGAVMVMVDANGNGVPDDGAWYELKGAGYDLPETVKHYTITYYRPDASKQPNGGEGLSGQPDYIADASYIKWTDNQGKSGYVAKNNYHEQPYWPQDRLEESRISFSGTLLTNVAHDASGKGTDWTCRVWEYGYVDNLPNGEEQGFDIDWAIDANGHPVKLEWIDFVRVYSCTNEQAGWLGELSTEITTAWDLNLLDEGRRVRRTVEEGSK